MVTRPPVPSAATSYSSPTPLLGRPRAVAAGTPAVGVCVACQQCPLSRRAREPLTRRASRGTRWSRRSSPNVPRTARRRRRRRPIGSIAVQRRVAASAQGNDAQDARSRPTLFGPALRTRVMSSRPTRFALYIYSPEAVATAAALEACSRCCEVGRLRRLRCCNTHAAPQNRWGQQRGTDVRAYTTAADGARATAPRGPRCRSADVLESPPERMARRSAGTWA